MLQISTPPPPPLQVRQLHEPDPLMRARAAGVLFNVAGFGPDCRLAMLEQVRSLVITPTIAR